MQFTQKASCAAQKKLRKLYNDEVRKGTWPSIKECGKLIGVAEGTLRDHLHTAKREGPIKDSLQKMQSYLDSLLSEVCLRLKRTYEKGVEKKLWRSIETCSEVTGVPSTTLSEHLMGRFDDEHLMVTLKKLQHAVSGKSEECTSQGFPLAREPSKVVDRQGSLVPSAWMNKLVSGELVFADQQEAMGARFLISAETLRQIEILITQKDLEDTQRLMDLVLIGLEELTRRFSLFIQEPEGSSRQKKWKQLSVQIDALYSVIRALEGISPCASARILKENEASMGRFRNLLNQNHEGTKKP